MVKRVDDGVAHGGAAPGIDSFQRFFELGNAVRKVLVEVEVEIVVKIDDESFVLRIAGLDESNSSFVDTRTLVAHAAAIVNHQPHTDGHVFAPENGEFLFDFIFENAKIFRLQAVGETLAVVEDARVQNDQVHVDGQLRTLFAGVGILTGGLRRGYGNLCKRARTENGRSANEERKMAQGEKQTAEELSGWARNIQFSSRR
jgi:hypothetical protein